MAIKWIENILDKIAQYLPDDEAMTEQERIYEEGKKKVYEMHQRESDLFYAEQAWLEGNQAKVFGETANGTFGPMDQVVFVDVHGNPLMEGKILAVENVSDDKEETEWAAKKVYLVFDSGEIQGKEDFFVQTYYVIKKH